MMATQSLWSKAIKPEHDKRVVWHNGNLETRFPMSTSVRNNYKHLENIWSTGVENGLPMRSTDR